MGTSLERETSLHGIAARLPPLLLLLLLLFLLLGEHHRRCAAGRRGRAARTGVATDTAGLVGDDDDRLERHAGGITERPALDDVRGGEGVAVGGQIRGAAGQGHEEDEGGNELLHGALMACRRRGDKRGVTEHADTPRACADGFRGAPPGMLAASPPFSFLVHRASVAGG